MMLRSEIIRHLVEKGFVRTEEVRGGDRGLAVDVYARGTVQAVVTFAYNGECRVFFEVPQGADFFAEMVDDFCKGDDFFLPPKLRRK
jgi:hypothetical protein